MRKVTGVRTAAGRIEPNPEAVVRLCEKDARLAAVIEAVEARGGVSREADGTLFQSVVHHIIGQQISTVAQATIWNRMREELGEVDAESIAALPVEDIQAFGTTFRKAGYIKDFADKVVARKFDLVAVEAMADDEAIAALASLSGIGVWTAEMILLFCLGRENIFSYDDLAIQRGLRMVYRHRAIPRPLFEKYRRRFAPYGTTASLYLWAVAGGAVEGLTDPAPKKAGSRKPASKKTAAKKPNATKAPAKRG